MRLNFRTFCAAAVAAIFTAGSASAVTMQAVWTGTVTRSANGSGAFGLAAGTSLDGMAAQFVFVYDLDRPGATRQTETSLFDAEGEYVGGPFDTVHSYGPAEGGRVSPILNASVIVGGFTESFGPNAGSVHRGGEWDNFYAQALDYAFTGVPGAPAPVGNRLHASLDNLWLSAEDGCAFSSLDQSASCSLVFDEALGYGSRGYGLFELLRGRDVTGAVEFASLHITRLDPASTSSPAPVPLPPAALLLISGIFGLGAFSRRPRRSRVEHRA